MSLLAIDGVWKSFGGQAVLRGVTLSVPDRAVLAVLGPSGCGKTTLLRLVAGFDAIAQGRIAIDGRVLDEPGSHVPAERRHIGYVPQDGTLFPHLTVAGNVGFGLTRVERHSGRIEEALRLTGIAELARRFPHQLSGGQQQRVALARALAPRPRLILLDEPFNALDLGLRRSVCADVVALLRAHAATAVLVTHDPEEAFASADLVAVMRAGEIVQCADPQTVYRQPVDAAAARLTGAAIFLAGEVRGASATTMLGHLTLHSGARQDGQADIMLRPEQIMPCPEGEGVPARVLASVFRGDHTMVTVALGDTRLDIRLFGIQAPPDRLWLRVSGACVAY